MTSSSFLGFAGRDNQTKPAWKRFRPLLVLFTLFMGNEAWAVLECAGQKSGVMKCSMGTQAFICDGLGGGTRSASRDNECNGNSEFGIKTQLGFAGAKINALPVQGQSAVPTDLPGKVSFQIYSADICYKACATDELKVDQDRFAELDNLLIQYVDDYKAAKNNNDTAAAKAILIKAKKAHAEYKALAKKHELDTDRRWIGDGETGTFDFEYKSSILPGWRYHLSATASAKEMDNQLETTGYRFKSDASAIQVSLQAEKGNLSLISQFRIESLDTQDQTAGVDATIYSLSFSPGYRVLTQQVNGFDFNVFGSLSVQEIDFTNGVDSQTRMTGGVGAKAGIAIPVGYISGRYNFQHNENLDGDIEITGEEYIQSHSFAIDYIAQITEEVLFNVGVSHVELEDMPNGVDDSPQHFNVGLSFTGNDSWKGAIQYFGSIDGSDDQGINGTVTFTW